MILHAEAMDYCIEINLQQKLCNSIRKCMSYKDRKFALYFGIKTTRALHNRKRCKIFLVFLMDSPRRKYLTSVVSASLSSAPRFRFCRVLEEKQRPGTGEEASLAPRQLVEPLRRHPCWNKRWCRYDVTFGLSGTTVACCKRM